MIIKVVLTIIILTILIIIIVKLVIAILIIILTVIIKIIIIMAIKIIIIVIKITITVIMKITIVLKLIKIVVQSHNPKTYICSIMTMPSKKFEKPSYRRTLPLQVQRSKGAKNRDLHTLFSTLSPKGVIVFSVLLE